MYINNDTPRYVNQYYDVEDIPETPKKEPYRTCNVSCVAMVVDEDVNNVLKHFIKKYGIKTDKFQWQKLLIEYIEDRGFECKKILDKPAYPDARYPSDAELQKMVREIKHGRIIFYHLFGHYQLMTGFSLDEEENELFFVFNDPAGDRRLKISDRQRESGHEVIYPVEFVKSEKLYGQCWSVKI